MKLSVASLILLFLMSSAICAEDWTRFRGPNGNGVVEQAGIPLEWSSNTNLKWRAELPGWGTSSPIVVGDRVYLTCYNGYGMDQRNPGNPKDLVRHLVAFDRSTGNEIWRRSVQANETEDPYKGFITQHGYASSTPATDGERIYVLFGKSGLFCFDQEGKQVWTTSLGTKSDPAKWGDGTSPILYDNLVVVNAGVLGNQFIALDKLTGEVVWKIEDPAFTNCWSSPTVATTEAGDQILFHVPRQVVAVDPKSGEKLWEMESPLEDSTCGSIVTRDGRAFLMGSRAGAEWHCNVVPMPPVNSGKSRSARESTPRCCLASNCTGIPAANSCPPTPRTVNMSIVNACHN